MRVLVVVIILMVPIGLAAQDESEWSVIHQITLGFGIGSASESSIFNIPADVKAEPDFFINLAYMYHLSPEFGLGMSLVGYSQSITEVTVIKNDLSTAQPEFDLSSIQFAAVGRYTFAQGGIKPYAFAQLGLVSGSVTSNETGSLTHLGVGVGGGVGMSFDIGEHVRLSAEGLATFGSASWKEKPFLNSTGNDFNPGFAGVLINISYLWQQTSE